MKQSVGPDTYLFPLPVAVVGTYDAENTPNMMTASWVGIVNSSPTMISVSLRKATYSYNSILERGAFTISIPSRQHLAEADYAGTKSGKRENKFETTELTPVHSEKVDAPYVDEFPVVLECKLIKYDDLGLHTMFVAEVMDVKIDEHCLLENGKPDIAAIDPVAYAHGEREYYETGEFLGKANKLWNASPLNSSLMSDKKKEAAQLVFDYYTKLDNAEPLEAFADFFHWDDFSIRNCDTVIDTYDKYREWYKTTLNTYFDKQHIINKLKITADKQNGFTAEIAMHFRARTWTKGTARSSKVKVVGNIEMKLTRDPQSTKLKINKYTVTI